jgi:carbon storage regulator CsrA
MLVLTREIGEDILIGDEGVQVGEHVVRILVCNVGNGEVKIGIEAPSDLKILRGELVREKEQVQ